MIIAPSILSADIGRLAEEIQRIDEAGADWVHVDIMDGHFVPNLTFGINVVKAVRAVTDLTIDCHMMVENPGDYIEDLAQAGADTLSIHVETAPHIHRLIQQVHQAGMKACVALNPGTPVEAVEPVLGDVDMVLVMTVNPGFGGQKFISSMLDKVRRLNFYRQDQVLYYKIQVDGGINDQTAELCREAGADVLVAGSYVYGQDSKVAIDSLRRA